MPARRPCVVYVVTSTGLGGAQQQVFDLASTMRSRGWRVAVVSMLPVHEQFLPLSKLGVRLATLRMTQGVADPLALVRLARLLRRWRPDVVHAHMVHAILLARLARLLAPVPRMISTMHNQEQGAPWRYYAFRLTDPLADMTTTVSQQAVADTISRHAVSPDRIVLVPNGIRTTDFEPDAELRDRTRTSLGLDDHFTWLTAGRLTEAKRHSDLLSAIEIVRRERPDVRLLIAGTGPLHDALTDQIESTGLAETVTMLGWHADVRPLMNAADAFVMSSAWEGLPIVLLEASASSLPIVATDVGGSRDAIVDGETGILAPPRAPRALADAMLRVMAQSPSERRAFGERARQRIADSFDIERVADHWERSYLTAGHEPPTVRVGDDRRVGPQAG